MTISLCLVLSGVVAAAEVRVSDVGSLRAAVASAKAGTKILIQPGVYGGGFHATNLQGTPEAPITIGAADPKSPPVFRGRSAGIQVTDGSHLTLRDLVIEGVEGNGLNLDDGGTFATPSHHVVLRDLVVRDVGPKGNLDGIKLSGLNQFRVENCTIERWGSGGSGIDMVGCTEGEIVGCTLRHGDTEGDSGVQAKGGSRTVRIHRCRFEHAGQRALNLGGSTGLQFFRPSPQGYEARDLVVEDCQIEGSQAAVAFVGVDGARVEHNLILSPRRWAFRVLQETTAEGFVPCRRGLISHNLIAFRTEEMRTAVNVGPNTEIESFQFNTNAWFNLDAPTRSRVQLPVPERDPILGVDPDLRPTNDGWQAITSSQLRGRVGPRDLTP